MDSRTGKWLAAAAVAIGVIAALGSAAIAVHVHQRLTRIDEQIGEAVMETRRLQAVMAEREMLERSLAQVDATLAASRGSDTVPAQAAPERHLPPLGPLPEWRPWTHAEAMGAREQRLDELKEWITGASKAERGLAELQRTLAARKAELQTVMQSRSAAP
jgi:hypothetical protein